jgi:acetolactate synthase-1/2/3 large subunit
MKASDYIVSFLIEHQITDVFGYPGGMVTHLMDSLDKYKDKISAHATYNEQGAAFAACGYAQVSLHPGVAYATSGPGATNLITGLCNAYFDSIPVIFITGQVNTYERKKGYLVRQKGFQEMEVVAMVSNVTKYAVIVTDAGDLRYHLEKAHACASEGRPGPVLLDIPMDVQRTEIEPTELKCFQPSPVQHRDLAPTIANAVHKALFKAKRPCILVGAGVQGSGMRSYLEEWVSNIKIPVLSSMLAIDILPASPYYYGFVGAYGVRHANFILAKCDLIISLGSRLDLRQTGANTDNFAVDAKLLRVDVDAGEFSHQIKKDEENFCIDLKELLPALAGWGSGEAATDFSGWLAVCDEIKSLLAGMDEQEANKIIRRISERIHSDAVVTTDVGQNQVWVAQSFVPRGQRILFSGGHGAMGYSLPAAIGAYHGSGKKVFAFTGDGGLQMNIQELQYIAREKVPVKIILLNNYSLGMIRQFQEMYFESNYVQTKAHGGYITPDFCAIAIAYGICAERIESSFQIEEIGHIIELLENDEPALIEIVLSDETYAFPKLAMGKFNQDQEPELDRDLYRYISML